jgi:hypothetical protein
MACRVRGMEIEVVSFLRKSWRKKRHKIYKKDTSLKGEGQKRHKLLCKGEWRK